jgi:hypothetical protein
MAGDWEKNDRDRARAAKELARAGEKQANETAKQTDIARGMARDARRAHEQDAEIKATVASASIDRAHMEGQAALLEAEANAAAAARETAAKEKLLAKQGEAAIASSVGNLSAEGVQQLDTYQKQKKDRENRRSCSIFSGTAWAASKPGASRGRPSARRPTARTRRRSERA